MRLLIGAQDRSRIIHWEEFGRALSRFGVEWRVVNNIDVVDGFPTKKIYRWGSNWSPKRFNGLINHFKPDAILTDGLRHFGTAALKSGIPLIVFLAGDFWEEVRQARDTRYRSFPRSIAIRRLERMGTEILSGSSIIMPASRYLEGIVRSRLPDKPTHVLRRVMDPSSWHPESGTDLVHPCVGMVQKAVIWSKAKEMLVLDDVLDRLHDVTFYWAGGGPHAQDILRKLQSHTNFKWLGELDYPRDVRRFLTEIDIYALFTGLDMAPRSLREALLMEKPAIASNIGGVPEIIEDGRSGILVDVGDPDMICEKIRYLLDNPNESRRMGRLGRKNTIENVSSDKVAEGFVRYIGATLDLH